MKWKFSKPELEAVVSVITTAGQHAVRVVVYACRAIRAQSQEEIDAALAQTETSMQAVVETAVAIIDSAE